MLQIMSSPKSKKSLFNNHEKYNEKTLVFNKKCSINNSVPLYRMSIITVNRKAAQCSCITVSAGVFVKIGSKCC